MSPMHVKHLLLPAAALAALLLAGCAAPPPSQPQAYPGVANPALLQVSPECLAAKLRPAESMPVSLIPEAVLRQARSGFVAVRYDVVAGKAANVVVVASEPPGLYDSYAVRHAGSYTEPSGATVRGCIMTTNIKF
jgi:hypothetical protein